MKLLLIDGDILIYQAISAAETEVEFEPDVWAMSTDLAEAKATFETAYNKLCKAYPDYRPHLCVSDPEANFRKEIYPDYKANRKKLRKPIGFAPFRQWVRDTYECLHKPKLEADDVIGILATKPGNDALIWSIDKDLMQIPGKHLVDGNTVRVQPEEGDAYHFTQTLTGDAVDGYPGCPGIGPKNAEKVLNACYEWHGVPIIRGDLAWKAIVAAYVKAGLTEADALVQARIARILRWDDWDQKTQTVRLWTP